MITIRLMGMPEDVAILAAYLSTVVEVLESSVDYPNRGASPLVRRYLTCRVTDHMREIVVTRGREHKGNCTREATWLSVSRGTAVPDSRAVVQTA